MSPERKRRPKSPVVAERTLPAELLLEIAARSEPITFVRCAAVCKSLRREILHPSFLRRVCTNEDGAGIIPPCILAYLHDRKQDPLVTLVHPVTPAASSFTDGSLAPYMLRGTIDINRSYEPLLSRGSLVVLRRRNNSINIGGTSKRRCHDLCVFDPMTGDRTYLSCRPDYSPKYVLLTAADGIGCSFRLIAANVHRCNQSGVFRITVQATIPSGTSWGPITQDAHGALLFRPLELQRQPVVLHGGIIHWLLSDSDQVLTYDIRTERLGTVKLPPTNYAGSQRILGTLPDGRRLRLLGVERFKVSMWVQLSGGWTKEAVIDVEHKLGSVDPSMWIEFKHYGERSGVVLLQAYRYDQPVHRGSRIVLDLETEETHKINSSQTSVLFEVDLSARLHAMKIY
ncbi:unnamed protein product [Alopecurus aequalis]